MSAFEEWPSRPEIKPITLLRSPCDEPWRSGCLRVRDAMSHNERSCHVIVQTALLRGERSHHVTDSKNKDVQPLGKKSCCGPAETDPTPCQVSHGDPDRSFPK